MDPQSVVKRFKSYIELNDLSGAQGFFAGLVSMDEPIAWDYIYQKVYLHACLKKRHEFVDWLTELFNHLDPIEQVALRQLFPYGRYLFQK